MTHHFVPDIHCSDPMRITRVVINGESRRDMVSAYNRELKRQGKYLPAKKRP